MRNLPRKIYLIVLIFLMTMMWGKGRFFIKRKIVQLLFPLWNFVNSTEDPHIVDSHHYEDILTYEGKKNIVPTLKLMCYQLLQENLAMKNLLKIKDETKTFDCINRSMSNGDSSFFYRRNFEEKKVLKMFRYGAVANVIFRSPEKWSSLLLINVGNAFNERVGKKIIEKNCPVVLGNCVVGVVENVEDSVSFVRLITDPKLKLSVRTARGYAHFFDSQYHAALLLKELDNISAISDDKKDEIAKMLYSFLNDVESSCKDLEGYVLAKGEIHGKGSPLWRSKASKLVGIDFNYDFEDSESSQKFGIFNKEIPLVNLGDILVTSGMDGIFPAGLEVGIVTKIHKQKGSFGCNIEADPIVGSLNFLSTVVVLPSMKN